MAVSNYDRYGLLDYWRVNTLEDIWAFNQVDGTQVFVDPCPQYLQVHRDQIARALSEAQAMLAQYVGYFIRPTYIVDEVVELQPVYRRGSDQHHQLLQLRWGFVKALGTRATTLLEADTFVTYSNVYAPSIDDTATVTLTLSEDVALDEIEVFFRVADGAPSAANPQWRIQPIRIEKNGLDVVITGHRALFVKPNAIWQRPYEGVNQIEPRYADTQDSGDFVTAVDVYRIYPDATNAVQLMSTGTDCNCLDDAVTTATGYITNRRLGLFQVACNSCQRCKGQTRRIKVSYIAGEPLDSHGNPEAAYLNALVRYANAEMPRNPCVVCDQTTNVWASDREPALNTTQTATRNPFGMLKGHDVAYRFVRAYALGQGGALHA